MATGKRYYWIKLKDSFMSSDMIDYLMGQPDGANYVVLYHTFRTQTHGRKAPPEYRKPKCLLFDCWLEQPYKKCEACKKACMEAEYDNGTTAFHG